MSRLTRRECLSLAGAVPLGLWLGQRTLANSTTPVVRSEARTTDGQAMLAKYALAVGLMKAKPDKDPLSWNFQWYTHWVRDDTNKAKELARVYPQPSDEKTLADKMWNTCQAHFGMGNASHFLPWHRAFVLYFEAIIRAVLKDATFALPYWDYSSAPKPPSSLPPEFLMKDDKLFKSLYVENRNPWAKDGKPIDFPDPNSNLLSTAALKQCTYEPAGALSGFCQELDDKLHGYVHGLVGDGTNMGDVPWAANDPIFWLHHANIDRIWASWNTAGRTNPTFGKEFTFADKDGKATLVDLDKFGDTAALGYRYDRLDKVPDCPTSKESLMTAAAAQITVAKAGSITLGPEPRPIVLDPVPEREGAEPVALGTRLSALKEGQELYLIAKNIRAEKQPGVLFSVFMGPKGVEGREDRNEFRAGSISFFNGVGHSGHGVPEVQEGPERFVSFNVTEVLRKLRAKDLLAARPELTLAPIYPRDLEGSLRAASMERIATAKATIGELRLVQQ